MKKSKSYKQYKEEASQHNESIVAKYGAPPEAKPPADVKDKIPKGFDRQFRAMSFTRKRSLQPWLDKKDNYDFTNQNFR